MKQCMLIQQVTAPESISDISNANILKIAFEFTTDKI